MIERRSGARFLAETPDASGIGGEMRRQQLQRNPAAQLLIARQINFAHSSAPDLAYELIMANRLSVPRAFRRQPISRHRGGRRFNEVFRAVVKAEQGLNFATQFLVARAG